MVPVVNFTPDTADVVDAHVIPGNLSPAQSVITSQLSDSDSSGTLLKSSHSPDSDSDIPLPHQSSVQLLNWHKSLVNTSNSKGDMERHIIHPILMS